MLPLAERVDFSLSSSGTNRVIEAVIADERLRLVRFCAHLTGHADVAEDLAQETLLEAWRNQQKLDEQPDREGWAKWLSAIARNVCMRWLRNHSRDLTRLASFRQYQDETALSIEDMAADDADIEIELERDELAQLLDRALALLPPTTRDVLIARYIHETPHAEIAQLLGLKEDALEQRLYRGKLALRQVITTSMSKEAEAYGISPPGKASLEQETRIWCPMCGKCRLTRYADPSMNMTGFFCSNCWHIAAANDPQLWNGITSHKSILARQLSWLGNRYWQAINTEQVTCDLCGHLAYAVIRNPQEIPSGYHLSGGQDYHALHIICPACHDEDLNPLPHLTLDTPEAQLFWRKHPRIRWLPGQEIDYAGQPALIGSFQSITESAQLDVIYQRETLHVLGVHENSR